MKSKQLAKRIERFFIVEWIIESIFHVVMCSWLVVLIRKLDVVEWYWYALSVITSIKWCTVMFYIRPLSRMKTTFTDVLLIIFICVWCSALMSWFICWSIPFSYYWNFCNH